ncbi:hypothetical protein ACJJTC_003173 [Scirpophaga incertulas]
MKLIILVIAITWCNAAKLDKTYLPPRNAPTSGGSGNFLRTPLSGAYPQNNREGSGFPQNRNTYSQNQNDIILNGNTYSQGGNDYSQGGHGFSESGNDQYNNGNGFDGFAGRPERAQAAFERNAAILRQDNQNDGETYSYAYETENGIYAEENGVATNGVEAQGGYSYTGDDGQIYTIRYTADQNGFVPQGDHIPTPPPIPEEILKALEQNAQDEAAGIYDDGSYNEAKYAGNDEYGNGGNINTYNNNVYNQNQYRDDEDSIVTNSALFRNSPGSFNQGVNNQRDFNNQRSNGVDKSYLPPFAQQRNSNRPASSRGRPQSFSSRNGYRY